MTDGQRAQDANGRWFTWRAQPTTFASGAQAVIWVQVYDVKPARTRQDGGTE